jgi:ribulose-5-phosphate 4-epimerase/fuculose-1-phosphate aldolase
MTDTTGRPTLGLDEHWEERRKLAVMCRTLASLGYIGAMGHASMRVPGTDLVLMSTGAGLDKAALRADQVFVYDVHGELIHHPGGELTGMFEPLERPIHIRIHRDRPEVLCVAHLHSPHSTLLGIADRPIVPVFNQAFYLYEGIPTWDDPSLVVNDEQAGRLSAALGGKVACQMRGHGSVVVGETVEVALMNCYSIEENARYQIAAESLGGAVPFAPDIVEATARFRTAMRDDIAAVLWAYFARRATGGMPL